MPERTQTWDLFIAHAGPDEPTAKQLYDLVQARARTFLDSVRIKLGDNWDTTLAVAQTESLVTVVLVSANTAKAYYQREEIAAAIAMARNDGEAHRVVPLYIGAGAEAAAVPYGLRLKHGLTLSDDFSLADAAERLLELLNQLGSAGEGSAAGVGPMVYPERSIVNTCLGAS